MFVATASPARSESPEGYQAWGHSTVVDPWGEVVATTEHSEDIICTQQSHHRVAWRDTQAAAHACAGAELDFERQDEVRGQIPILSQKRTDVFSTAIHLNDAALRGRL